ncbi:MAG: CIA30 family protein [Planctomycetota bacterium]
MTMQNTLWMLFALVLCVMIPAIETSLADDAGMDSKEMQESAEAVLLTDFTDGERNARWAVVNDNVMGGRSDGYMTFADPQQGVMTLTGDINTNGGGFTSVRMRVDPEMFESEAEASILPDLRAVRLRVRADTTSLQKPFALRLEDRVRRSRGINFRAVLPLDTDVDPEQWQTVTVAVADLQPTHHGNRLDPDNWAPLDTSQLGRVGIILNNVSDGPYRLEIDRIELLR